MRRKSKVFRNLAGFRVMGEFLTRWCSRITGIYRPVYSAVSTTIPLLLFSSNGLYAQAISDDGHPIPQVYMASGLSFYNAGDAEHAIRNWSEAAKLFEIRGEVQRQIEALANLASAYQLMGSYDRAINNLEYARQLAQDLNDVEKIANLLGSLGNVYLLSKREAKAYDYSMEGLALAKQLENFALASGILNTLGNIFISRKEYAKGLDAYTECIGFASRSGDRLLEAKAFTNAGTSLIKVGKYSESKSHFDQAFNACKTLTNSREKASILINIGLGFTHIRSYLPEIRDELLLESFNAINQARTVAKGIEDTYLLAYAQGYLGRLYEAEYRYSEAMDLTRSAIFSAQRLQASESLYLWQWQSGRLLAKMGEINESISAYRRAIHTIQSIRQEMSDRYEYHATTFRETVGSAYFELVDLLLQRAATTANPVEYQSYLSEARNLVELLKLDELRDYFEDECIAAARAKVTPLDVVSQTAIVIYPILLPNRIELLVSLPSGLKQISTHVPSDVLKNEVREFHKLLKKRGLHEYLPKAQKLYDWLIRPLEAELTTTQIDTLVFVPDGPLRVIPMASLHDGNQFLINKYAVATTPGLSLTDPQSINKEDVTVLAAGLTEPVQGFSALPHISKELDAIHNAYGGKILQDQRFIEPVLEREMKQNKFTIIHIASHGQFKSKAEDTFILTFDGKLTMDRLNQLVGYFRYRDDPLELLTLSACETAAGDDRAALGLAGIAVKAGARTALGTLWVVNDQASSLLIAEFYHQLKNPSVSRAVALQRAQLKLINDVRYNHPYYWSPFLLINNWL